MTEEICEICGKKGRHEPCSSALDAAKRRRRELDQAMLAMYAAHGSFGLCSEMSRNSYLRARELLETHLKRSLQSLPEQALEGHGWWFIPEGWIGMLGFVVEVQSSTIYPLGSGLLALYGRNGYQAPWGAIEAYLDGKVEPVHAALFELLGA